MKKEPEDGGISEVSWCREAHPGIHLFPASLGAHRGMPSYCTGKKREEGMSGKWYVRMLGKKIMATFTEHLICAGRIPGAVPVLCPSQPRLSHNPMRKMASALR